MYNQFFRAPGREDMLAAPVRPLILRIALPSLAAMLASGLCTLLDALLLSRHAPGVSAAAGVSFPLAAAQQAVGFTLGMGAGSHISRSIGAGDAHSARQAGASALLLALLLGALLAIAGLALLTPLLAALGADAQALPHAAAYARLLLIASPAVCVSPVISSLLRAQGRTDLNLAAIGASSAAGVALDLSLIPRFGAHGAGVSLLAREALACLLLAIAALRAKGLLRPRLRDVTLRLPVLQTVMRSGLPSLLRQGAMAVSGALLSRAAAAIGPAALSGMGLASRALALIASAAIGFGQGFAPVCGVSFGAGDARRVQQAYRFSMRVLAVSLLAMGALLYLSAGRLLALLGANAQAAAFAVRVLRAQSAVLPLQGAVILMNMRTQSCASTVRASLIAASRQGIFLIPLALILPRLFGETGLVFCQSIADALAFAFSLLVMRCGEGRGRIDRTTRRD